MSFLKKYPWRGVAVVAPFTVAMVLLFAGPAGTAHALALSNNLQTTVSLSTNAASGSNQFTTLAPITVTCGVVDITAGGANGVSGVTLVLDAGWTFAGGVAPTVGYAWGGGPTGDAVGTIASPTTITVAILASCDPGDVITFTGVQVKPLTATSGAATINANINTADVSSARLATIAFTPPPETEPEPESAPVATPAPIATPAPTPVATPTPPVLVVAIPTPAPVQVVAPPVVAPPQIAPPSTLRPPSTGNGGLIGADGTSPVAFWLLIAAAAGLTVVGRRLTVRDHRAP